MVAVVWAKHYFAIGIELQGFEQAIALAKAMRFTVSGGEVFAGSLTLVGARNWTAEGCELMTETYWY